MASSWRHRAACAGMDWQVFFPDARGTGVNPATAYDTARAVCSACPVREPCLEDALRYSTTFDSAGMFGGCSPSERAAIRSARRKAKEEDPAA